jgi:hypothetical protein
MLINPRMIKPVSRRSLRQGASASVQGQNLDKWVGARMALPSGEDHPVTYAVPGLLPIARPPRRMHRRPPARTPYAGVGIRRDQASSVRG